MPLDLQYLGLKNLGRTYRNLTTPQLYEEILRRSEGAIGSLGPIVVETGAHTGRSPKDKFIVKEPGSENDVWWGDVNQPFDDQAFDALWGRVQAYLEGRDVFVQDCYAGAAQPYRLSCRVITQLAWHNLFARHMFIREYDAEQLANFDPDWHLVYVPGFKAVAQQDKTRSEVFVLIHFGRRLILIGGTHYSGELKKSLFTILNYLLPKQDVMSLHCSANKNRKGETALFFGLSGTGKTTLSASGDHILIGDDEHGWSADGIFNLEGGCYAKIIRLNVQDEPLIHATTQRFGTILENVVIAPDSRIVDLDDDSLTENARASYPIHYIANASLEGVGNHPKNIIMLTCDAFGVLPPVARLTPEQAMYHFISGYTAKVAGTECGIEEPVATFSPCFGAPFMVLHPTFYTRQLGDRIRRHQTQCWLVNTGWSGGPYGEGDRIHISYTRAIVAAILDGRLSKVKYRRDPAFAIAVPLECPGVPTEVLQPRTTWRDPCAYDDKAQELVGLFIEHFSAYEGLMTELRQAAPQHI